MTAIAFNLDYILIVRISTVVAAKFIVATNRTETSFVATSVILLSHIIPPVVRKLLVACASN